MKWLTIFDPWYYVLGLGQILRNIIRDLPGSAVIQANVDQFESPGPCMFSPFR